MFFPVIISYKKKNYNFGSRQGLPRRAAALRRALGAAKPLRNGAVIFRREWREKAGDGAAAEACERERQLRVRAAAEHVERGAHELDERRGIADVEMCSSECACARCACGSV